MPVTPNLLERILFLHTNKAPGPVLDLLGAGGFRAVNLATELGLFEGLARTGPATVDTLAEAIDTEPVPTGHLLDLLVPLGYLDRKGDRYRLTSMTEAFLLEGSPEPLARWLTFWQALVFPYLDEHLASVIKTGRAARSFYDWLSDAPERWPLAQATFDDLATVVLDEVVEKVPIEPQDGRLLDLGGGHGRYAIGLCQAHTGLQATVFDQQAPLATAEANVAAAGLADRIALQAGDYNRDPIGDGYDLVLLFNVLHGHPPDQAREVVAKAARALAPGGRLVVADQYPQITPGPATRGFVALMGLMYLGALGGRAHDQEAVEGWLAEAGLEAVEMRRLKKAPGAGLLLARRPS